MPRARSKDPFVAAIRTYFVPAFQPHGFKLRGKGTVMRIRNDIVQWMTVTLSAWGSKHFRGEFGANSLFYPREYLHFDIGDGGSIMETAAEGKCYRLWSAETQEEADKAMEKVVRLFTKQALPVLNSAQTVEGLSKQIELLRSQDHHRHFERGCCAARLRNYPQAIALLRRAIELYALDGRDWCAGFSNSCQELISAIERGETEMLLDRWVGESIDKLRLTEIARN